MKKFEPSYYRKVTLIRELCEHWGAKFAPDQSVLIDDFNLRRLEVSRELALGGSKERSQWVRNEDHVRELEDATLKEERAIIREAIAKNGALYRHLHQVQRALVKEERLRRVKAENDRKKVQADRIRELKQREDDRIARKQEILDQELKNRMMAAYQDSMGPKVASWPAKAGTGRMDQKVEAARKDAINAFTRLLELHADRDAANGGA